jgi:hypothetical protein
MRQPDNVGSLNASDCKTLTTLLTFGSIIRPSQPFRNTDTILAVAGDSKEAE